MPDTSPIAPPLPPDVFTLTDDPVNAAPANTATDSPAPVKETSRALRSTCYLLAGQLMMRMGVSGVVREDFQKAAEIPDDVVDKLLSGAGYSLTLDQIDRFAQTLGATVRVQLVGTEPPPVPVTKNG